MGFAGVSSRTTRRAGLLAVFALLLLTILLVGEGSAKAASGLDLGKAVSTATAPVTKTAAPVTQTVAKVTATPATPASSAPAASAPACQDSSCPGRPDRDEGGSADDTDGVFCSPFDSRFIGPGGFGFKGGGTSDPDGR